MIHRSAAIALCFTAKMFRVLAAATALTVAGASSSPAQPAATPVLPDASTSGLIYSPWTKICTETGGPDAKPAERKRVCFTTKEARLKSGLQAAGIVLVEPDKDKKVLRVLLPLGMRLPPGTRIVIDKNRPMTSHYAICLSEGCIAEYDATTAVINRLKKGKQLVVQAINANGQAVGINLPLDNFAKVIDGPPTDTSAFEAAQQAQAEALRRRINEARELVARAQPQAGSQGGAQGRSQSGSQAK